MKQTPILFKTEMVEAILDGRKTQTRRIIDGAPSQVIWNPIVLNGHGGWCDDHGKPIKCRFGQPGDRLWVKETFTYVEDTSYDDYASNGGICYKASCQGDRNDFKWKPSLFMPREASRITLEITDIRVERLLSISEEDAIAEGVDKVSKPGAPMTLWRNYSPKDVETFGRFDTVFAAQESYFSLWDSINGKQSHLLNPWLWVIEFKQI